MSGAKDDLVGVVSNVVNLRHRADPIPRNYLSLTTFYQRESSEDILGKIGV